MVTIARQAVSTTPIGTAVLITILTLSFRSCVGVNVGWTVESVKRQAIIKSRVRLSRGEGARQRLIRYDRLLRLVVVSRSGLIMIEVAGFSWHSI